MLLGQILYTSVLSAHTIANQEKQSILQSLVKRQVLYDDSISIDSVIAWSEQLYAGDWKGLIQFQTKLFF